MKKILAIIITCFIFTGAFSVVSAADIIENPEEKIADPTISKEVNDGKTWVKTVTSEKEAIVKFRLTGSMPSNWDHWKAFIYSFVDTIPEGQTYMDDIQVVFTGRSGNVDITDKADISYENRVLSARYDDLKKVVSETSSDSKLYVYYSVKIDSDAPDTMVNYAHIEYENGTSVTDKATVLLKEEPEDPGKTPTEDDPSPSTPGKTPTPGNGGSHGGTSFADKIKTGDIQQYLFFGIISFISAFAIASIYYKRRRRTER